ncbi:MAG TPA: hypothetical protein VJX67_25100 [Blastocatellia bacterium]|nr:hypothetical protein [Blastocatellia bacterium]
MKKKLERIDDTKFRSLDNVETLGAVGGATFTNSHIQTLFHGEPTDLILDLRID